MTKTKQIDPNSVFFFSENGVFNSLNGINYWFFTKEFGNGSNMHEDTFALVLVLHDIKKIKIKLITQFNKKSNKISTKVWGNSDNKIEFKWLKQWKK